MRVILFQDRFAAAVRSGAKKQTIRKTCDGIRPGTVLSLRRWTGKPYRSKQEVLREAVCKTIQEVVISTHCVIALGWHEDEFARADGFASWPEMRDWFDKVHGLPFDGYLIRWE